jgi:hypothetical protein
VDAKRSLAIGMAENALGSLLADQDPRYQSEFVFGDKRRRDFEQAGDEARRTMTDNCDNWGPIGRSLGRGW